MIHDFHAKLKTRLIVVMLGCFFLGSTVLIRAGYIQLLSNSKLESMARRQYQTRSLVQPRRGTIFDRNGEALAVNIETNSLAANPSKIKNKRSLARLLARATGVPYPKLVQKLNEDREFIWIKRHLTDLELKKFRKFRVIDSDGDLVDGLWLVKESERAYPHGLLASHILGGVNVDSQGLEGVELWKNEELRGKVTSVTAIKDALGRPTYIDAVAAKSGQDGESLTLTLDGTLQFEVEQELRSAMVRTGSKSGTVVVMAADTGEILAMANEPSFNANEKKVPPDRRRNRAVTDGYEPGSTFKAILMASVLSNGGRLSDQVWGERGSFMVQGHKISEAEAKEKFEWVNLKKMIQVSSNVAAAKFALRIGADKYLKTIKAFGVGSKSGLGFPGEISGKIPNRKDWNSLAVANIGFGQGILVTPIQMARAYAAIVNGGYLVRPALIKKPDDLGKKPQTPFPKILSEKVTQDMIEALETVTNEGGTGTKAVLPGYRVAGKTGTAQMVDPKSGRYSKSKYVASFIGFPVGLGQKVVIFASLSEPRGVYYASETAAPLFREVLSSVASRYGLPIDPATRKLLVDYRMSLKDKIRFGQAQAHSDGQNSPSQPGSQNGISSDSLEDLKLIKAASPQGKAAGWILPSLKGLSAREALQILRGHYLDLQVMGSGVISHQMPEPGRTVAEGGTVRLILSEP